MQHTRRDFLKYVMALSAAGSISPLRVLAATAASQECVVVGSTTTAVFANLVTHTVKEIELGFPVHTFMRHPKHPMRYLGFEKWGTNGAAVDFETGEVTKISSGDKHIFYGHGRYIEEKGAFYVVRASIETGKGHLVAYDPETYQTGEDFVVTPGGLHECRRMPDKTLAIASSGIKADSYGNPSKGTRVAKSSIVFVDIAGKGDVIRELTIDDPEQMIGHFQVTKTGKILAMTCPLHLGDEKYLRTADPNNGGQVYFSEDGKQPLRKMEWGAKLQREIKGEILSAAMNDDQTRAVVTNPMGENIILVDMEKEKVIKAIDMLSKGVVWDPSLKGYVISGKDLVLIDPDFKKMTRLDVHAKAGFLNPHSIIETV